MFILLQQNAVTVQIVHHVGSLMEHLHSGKPEYLNQNTFVKNVLTFIYLDWMAF